MESSVVLEVFGYIGSVLVVCSMLMSSVVKLRLINMIGSIISGIYAVLCGALPLFLMNMALIVINGYNLYKLLMTEKHYELVVCDVADGSLKYFLEFHKKDIQTHFPKFRPNHSRINTAYMVYCKGDLAGLLLGFDNGDGVLEIQLDYTILSHRDCSVGKFIYSELPLFGIYEVFYAMELSQEHIDYLLRMGFMQNGEIYTKKLKTSRDL